MRYDSYRWPNGASDNYNCYYYSWQLGHCKWGCTPTNRGFDSFRGLLLGQQDHTTHMNNGGYDWWSDEEVDRSAEGSK